MAVCSTLADRLCEAQAALRKTFAGLAKKIRYYFGLGAAPIRTKSVRLANACSSYLRRKSQLPTEPLLDPERLSVQSASRRGSATSGKLSAASRPNSRRGSYCATGVSAPVPTHLSPNLRDAAEY